MCVYIYIYIKEGQKISVHANFISFQKIHQEKNTYKIQFAIFINKKCSVSAIELIYLGARGVMVIVVGNGHGDTSSNPRRG